MAAPNYLIGFGERLVRTISLKQGGGEKAYPQTFDEALRVLASQWRSTDAAVASLPTLACPDGKSVISLTLHSSFLARSYYPSSFLGSIGLHAVGSRGRVVRSIGLQRNDSKRDGLPVPAPEIYVA